MRAGLLKERITLLRPVVTKDAYHGQQIRWEEAASTRARVQNAGVARGIDSHEVFFAGHPVMTVRIYHAITADMRIRWRGEDYAITGLDPDPDRQELRITTAKVNP